MEYTYGEIRQSGASVTGRTEIGLKTTPAAAGYDFWGGALRVARECAVSAGKAALHLEDGRGAKILIDGVGDEEQDGSRVITFIGCEPLATPVLPARAGDMGSAKVPGNSTPF